MRDNERGRYPDHISSLLCRARRAAGRGSPRPLPQSRSLPASRPRRGPARRRQRRRLIGRGAARPSPFSLLLLPQPAPAARPRRARSCWGGDGREGRRQGGRQAARRRERQAARRRRQMLRRRPRLLRPHPAPAWRAALRRGSAARLQPQPHALGAVGAERASPRLPAVLSAPEHTRTGAPGGGGSRRCCSWCWARSGPCGEARGWRTPPPPNPPPRPFSFLPTGVRICLWGLVDAREETRWSGADR